ncbi:Methionine--tRNA ligase, mitochondrial [Toxocara canis]|uniref:Methionine--tRNA ligase, mitochondrial n=1 Tax=Toxocara canis TaxID=6265 RepID=A0A0B2V3J8_TOXCA|nr:Methionine--tRNA ligase, mitochondrial [Toxocara canis]
MRRIAILLQFTRRKHFFVTTPIFYANASPHIGHLYSALIADAAYRWNVLKRADSSGAPPCSLFTTGTDEHGTKIQKAAQAAGVQPKLFCDDVSASFRKLLSAFNIKPTDFIRTSESRHKRVVEDVWLRLSRRGYIRKAKYAGWYSTTDECFYSQRDLEDLCINGTMKKGLVKRINQSKLLIREDYIERGISLSALIVEVSKQTRSPVEWIEEDNYVFDLSQFYEPIRRWLLENDVIRPKHYLRVALQYLDIEETLSISRDRKRLEWGIPVPQDQSQTIYVWMDALVNYLTVSGFPRSHHDYWPPDWQVIGKDILKFHAVFWPAFLMAAELPLPRRLFVHAHWLVDGVKMSKSIGNVIDPFVVAETLTVDGLRYFLLRQGTPHVDGNFTITKAVSVVNGELVNSLGNLMQRACVEKLNPDRIYPSFEEKVMRSELAELGLPLIESLGSLREKCSQHFDELMIYKALEELSAVVRQANAFFQLFEPWKLADGEKRSTILHVVYETMRICGILLQPVVPDYANKLLTRLGMGNSERGLESAVFGWNQLAKRTLPSVHEPVMRRIKFSVNN